MSFDRNIVFCIVISLLGCSCASRRVREAQHVVAQADSLWHEGKMYGVDAGDSATLAQAYETFGHFPLSWLPLLWRGRGERLGEVSYHYGKLLRAKDDPVAAMQAFINATHSGTKDYHILGRVYSNMGSVCHLAGEFPLSYDMYGRSANMFLHAKDTLSYYYALNDMAFELAEQGKKEETFILLDSIEHNCNDESVKIKTLETKALLNQSLKCYDSVIAIVDSLQSIGYSDVIGLMMKARAFHHLNCPDSAVYYANNVVQHSPIDACAIAAYYILSHSSDKINKDSVLILTSARADAQKAWAYSQGKLSQSVQLLDQDLNRKPNWRWLYVLIVTLVVGICIYIYVYCKRRQHALWSQRVEDLRHETESMQERHTQIVQELSLYTNKFIAQIEETCTLLRQSPHLSTDLCWNDFESMCHLVDKQLCMIASKLRQKQILNETEVRLCILVLLDLNRKQISKTLPYSLNSVGKLKDHTAKSLGTTGKNLRQYLINLALEG